MESGSTRQNEYKRPDRLTGPNRKYHNKRRVTPEYWYMMLLQNPSRPCVLWKPFPDRESCEDKIEAEFGNNSLFFAVKGKYIIKYGALLTRTIRRKLGKIPQYRDKDEWKSTSYIKGLEKY